MQLSSFDLNLLVSLDALLAESSVTRAAERLHVGQPAMSATLGRLRRIFDEPLLVQRGRVLTTTPFADSLRAPVAAVLSQVEAIVNLGRSFDPSTDARVFTVIASDYVALVLLRPLIERLQAVAPSVQIRVRPVDGLDSAGQLNRGEVDLVIAPEEFLPHPVPKLSEPLFEDEFVCVMDAGAATRSGPLTPEGFSELPYLVSNHGSIDSIVEARFDALGVQRNVEMVANSFVMAPFLLPGTRLVTVIQRKLALLLMADRRFGVLATPVELDRIVERMVWSPRHATDPGHEWFRSQLRDLATSL